MCTCFGQVRLGANSDRERLTPNLFDRGQGIFGLSRANLSVSEQKSVLGLVTILGPELRILLDRFGPIAGGGVVLPRYPTARFGGKTAGGAERFLGFFCRFGFEAERVPGFPERTVRLGKLRIGFDGLLEQFGRGQNIESAQLLVRFGKTAHGVGVSGKRGVHARFFLRGQGNSQLLPHQSSGMNYQRI